MLAMEVGVRELRNNLSRYLARVRGGEEVVVIAEGAVTPAQRPKRRAGKPIKSKGTVSDLVADQRR
jgi:antitoxin (DNA-binding transcriptional repressor) of toxin-antitoxin stability system